MVPIVSAASSVFDKYLGSKRLLRDVQISSFHSNWPEGRTSLYILATPSWKHCCPRRHSGEENSCNEIEERHLTAALAKSSVQLLIHRTCICCRLQKPIES
ncbi:hypothetical protein MCOR21_000073 [Pyricularia oryzae]|uniref:Uncharacterized protein n=2 Tax=Pyricularia TaxID=48558 RepID=A0ABQ8P0F9_PYRGI|nr:hypothetical protein MCOR01_000187 [Pyricularia oryzae]KAI6304773.1 hypothetical protein MCOR33_000287 [Pyricularia grisea]KAI6287568.1 hypothetical protein MCOR26_000469 [Pyricularia oryzae]KAI6387759.1 hypothetical protein MCOR32_000395 [Pyricularia oryzae]KAI6417511.1 hypothetical protein MCOR20_000350 [Pyricularia oryzae]